MFQTLSIKNIKRFNMNKTKTMHSFQDISSIKEIQISLSKVIVECARFDNEN